MDDAPDMPIEFRATEPGRSMVERIARSMCRLHARSEKDVEKFIDRHHVAHLAAARAVLAELREPTEAMTDAARDWAVEKYGAGVGRDASTGCWQSMIDAALSGEDR